MKTAWIDAYGIIRVRETQMYTDENKVFVVTPGELEEHANWVKANVELAQDGSEI